MVLAIWSLEKCRGSQNPNREHECGRPLGLKFNEKTGDLYIADAYHGLMVVRPGETIARVVATEAGGIPLRFTNSVEIDEESGIVYFTDTSTRYQRRYVDCTCQLWYFHVKIYNECKIWCCCHLWSLCMVNMGIYIIGKWKWIAQYLRMKKWF